jgi:hypothetical protein
MNQYLKDTFKVPSLEKISPSPLRFTLIIYSLLVLYRVNNHRIEIFEMIVVLIFPAFFLGYVATISPEYLNILKPIDQIQDESPKLGLMTEIHNLEDHEIKTLFIFIPIYILFTYQLNKKLFHKIASKFNKLNLSLH